MADDVAADKTPGFKVGEKKTLDEYHTLGKSHFDFCIYLLGRWEHYDALCQCTRVVLLAIQSFVIGGGTSTACANSLSSTSPGPSPVPKQCALLHDRADISSLDKEDDAMNRWKASLGLATGNSISDPNDPRLCIIKSLALVSPHCDA